MGKLNYEIAGIFLKCGFILGIVDLWGQVKGILLFIIGLIYVMYKIYDIHVSIDGKILENMRQMKAMGLSKSDIRKERLSYYRGSFLSVLQSIFNFKKSKKEK